ncbi:hypothetical protein [Pseudonocardia sp. TRM90224]|uniref:hypothetical protein n=1 Tax=Pseudonocardia sp. TRM90224 TaxID=2812678 RepID=UPI001E4BC0E5|nr:hypothetical protein [Pseudonocardia sp. TRM90224]
MGYDCTLHLVDEKAIRETFVPRLLGTSDDETALDRVHPGAAEVWAQTRSLLRTGDPHEAAGAISVAAVMFSASMLPYRYERGLALSLAMRPGDVFPDDCPHWGAYSPDDLFDELIAARPELRGRFPVAFNGNYSAGLFVPAAEVPGVLAWVEAQVASMSKGRQRDHRGMLAVLRAAVDRDLAYWEATDLAVPAAGEFPGDPALMWASYLGTDSMPATEVETAPMSPITSVLDDVVGDDFRMSHSDGTPRVELWDLSVWPPRCVLARDEFWVAAARDRPRDGNGRWLAFSTTDTRARPRAFTPILVEGSDDPPTVLPAKGPDGADLDAHECYFLGGRPVVLHEVKTHLLRFGGMEVGDPLPGPLWLGPSGEWEPIPGIEPAAVVKSILGDAESPQTGSVRLADGSDVLIWDGDGYELNPAGTGCTKTFAMGARRTYDWTSAPAGDDGFFYRAGAGLYEMHRGGVPRRHVEAWTNVLGVRPGPANGLLLRFGNLDSGDVGALYFPGDGTFIPFPPEMFDDQDSYNFIYWNVRDDRIVAGRYGYVAVRVADVLARPRQPVPQHGS